MTARPALPDGGTDPASILARNSATYETLAGVVARHPTLGPETTLQYVRQVATFAQDHHSGRFFDGRIENPVLQVGLALARLPARDARATPDLAPLPRSSLRQVLHVATVVGSLGGHTRTIVNWIRLDRESTHSLLITSQCDCPIPTDLAQAVASSGGKLVALPRAPRGEQARWLRRFAQSGFDLVILHHSGVDVVIVAALATDACPPVALVNHADHLFWMGGSVADAVINQRSVGKALGERRRFTRDNAVLPIPLTAPSGALTKARARSLLGIPDDQVMLVSVGRSPKYVPTPTHNFIRTAETILGMNPGAHVYLVGVSQSFVEACFPGPPHERLHALGSRDDPWPYQLAADIYLEGFPFGSQTALLEAALAGTAPVLALAPPCELLVANDDALWGVVENPPTEQDYVAHVSALIADPARRQELGAEVQRRVVQTHLNAGWLDLLGGVYRHMCSLRHRPGEIPVEQGQAAPTDLALCAWQAFSAQDGHSAGTVRREGGRLLRDTGYLARQEGDYRGALALLVEGGRLFGWDRRNVSAMLKLLPHWMSRRWILGA